MQHVPVTHARRESEWRSGGIRELETHVRPRLQIESLERLVKHMRREEEEVLASDEGEINNVLDVEERTNCLAE